MTKRRDHINEELTKLQADILRNRSPKQVFKTPPHYFENITERVFEKVVVEKPVEEKNRITLIDYLKSWMASYKILHTRPALAYAMIAVVCIGLIVFFSPFNKNQSVSIHELSYDELVYYINTSFEEGDYEVLYAVQSEEDWNMELPASMDQGWVEEYFINELTTEDIYL